MNLILLFEPDFTAPDRVVLTDRRKDHLRKVLRAKPGDRVACGRVNGKIGSGTVIHLDYDRAELSVCLDKSPPPPLPLTLVLGLPRPKMLKRIIRGVTSLGVKEIYLVNSWRVEKSFWQSPVLEDHKLVNYMALGLEQARDTVLPTIRKKRFFARFVKDELPGVSENTDRITAHPKADPSCPAGLNRPVTLAIGPEGGWIDYEIQALEDIGFTSYSIGPRILTVETAVPVLISRLFT